MVPVKKLDTRKVRSNFSRHAGEYDCYATVQKRVIEELCRLLEAPDLLRGTTLDIGTGTGALAAALTRQSPDLALTVMDIAHGMTCQARSRLPGAGACDGDAGRLPFRDDVFGLVVSSSVYQWVARLEQAFAEVHRVLQPGGIFAAALFGEQTLYELREAHCRAVAACRAETLSHVQSFPSCEDVRTALQKAGFTCRQLASYPDIDYHVDVPALLRQLKQIGADNASRERPRGLASRRVMQTMMSCYEELYRVEQGFPATYEVIVLLAEK